MFPCRTPWGFQNRSPDNCHIFRFCCGPKSARRCLFQCRTCLSNVWYPKINRFLIRNSNPSTRREADAKCKLSCYRRNAIFYKFLNNTGWMVSLPRHGIHGKRQVHRCSTTRSPPLYALATRSYARAKSRSSFCHTLYFRCYRWSYVQYRIGYKIYFTENNLLRPKEGINILYFIMLPRSVTPILCAGQFSQKSTVYEVICSNVEQHMQLF